MGRFVLRLCLICITNRSFDLYLLDEADLMKKQLSKQLFSHQSSKHQYDHSKIESRDHIK